MDMYKSNYVRKCLEELKNGKIDGIIKVLEKTLENVSSKADVDIKLVLRYIRSVSRYMKDKTSETDDERLYNSVMLCVSHLQKYYSAVEIMELDSFFINCIYWIIESLLRKKFYHHSLTISTFLRKHMQQAKSIPSAADFAVISWNLYTLFWNIALEHGKKSRNSDVAFELLCEGLYFMLPTDETNQKCFEKLTFCIQRYCFVNSAFNTDCLRAFLTKYQLEVNDNRPCFETNCTTQALYKSFCIWGIALCKLYLNVNIVTILHEFLGKLGCVCSGNISYISKTCVDVMRFCNDFFIFNKNSKLSRRILIRVKSFESITSTKSAEDISSMCKWFYYIFIHFVQTKLRAYQRSVDFERIDGNLDIVLLLCDICFKYSKEPVSENRDSSSRIFSSSNLVALSVNILRLCEAVLEQSFDNNRVSKYVRIAVRYIKKLLGNCNVYQNERMQHLVSLTTNFAKQCYSRNLYEETAILFEVILNGVANGRICEDWLKMDIYKEYEFLISCYINMKNFDKALEITVRGMILTELEFDKWFLWWIEVKKRSIGVRKDIMKKTVVDVLNETGLEVESAKKFDLLKQELAACEKEKKKHTYEEIIRICSYM